ncbi:MAG: precorrin-6Y C5,15-methyltransferase (decarboxylating) [Planctomycetota bacterium]|jgi:precorrin-6Y C5,15-methyltransferase (decarboxylating)
MSSAGAMAHTIHVIGLGVEKGARLSRDAEQALATSHSVIGSTRQLALAARLLAAESLDVKYCQALPKLAELKAMIEALPAGDITILASGDPLYFGIGRWLGTQFDPQQIRFYPSISSIQAVCNHLGLAQQDCVVASFHGRDLRGLQRILKRNKTLIILTDQHSHPRALASACVDAGFEQSHLWVCEQLGTDKEQYRRFEVTELSNDESFSCDPLQVSMIEVRGAGGVLPEFPGIDDFSFASDRGPGRGMFTKRETRLAVLSLIQPASGDVIWDIGAGCGGVATELAYWNDAVQVYAIEQHPERLDCLRENQHRFGTAVNLNIVDGRAPEALQGLPAANKVFIGGNDGELDSILQTVWQQLPDGGLLVASAVTADSERQLHAFAKAHAADHTEVVQIAISKGSLQEDRVAFKAKMPVTLFKLIKNGVSN